MEKLWADLRYRFRTLVKSPGFTLVVVTSLALGIGANTTIFTLINSVFLKVTVGLAAAFAVSRFVSSILYGISATDLTTFVGVPLLLLAVAFAASYLLAYRASRVDPLRALRYQ